MSSRRTRLWLYPLLLATVMALIVIPSIPFVGSRTSSAAVVAVARPDSTFSGTVTWNGANVNSAGTESSALSLSFSSSANVRFNWTSSTPVAIATARLQMIYFGAALTTRDVSSISPQAALTGSAVMNWTPGTLTYVLEGVFKITAFLLASNGSTAWSESFFVRTNAPYNILAALPILLLVVGAWEVYSVARSGREAAIGRKGAPPPQPPASPSAPPPAAQEPSPPPAESSATPPEESE